MKGFLSLFILFGLMFSPIPAHAGIFSFFEKAKANGEEVKTTENSQNTVLLQAVANINPDPYKKSQDISIVDDSAVETVSGPAGTRLEVSERVDSDQISIYTVRSGDTLSQIAQMFGVSSNTIIWANNLKGAKDIKINDQLVILPISGVKYIVKKGDRIETIATKFKADAEEIIKFNDLSNITSLTVGQEIIIPDGEVVLAETPKTKTTVAKNTKAYADTTGYFMRPVFGGVRTQGLHGGCRCGVDLANTFGTPVYAAASGKVIISKTSGWNGGYGTYVVIMHPNGTQTLYAHLSNNLVSVGSSIEKGEQIGSMGSSGRSTGSHLHFEVRGGRNPF
jgi:murein DD-endopeptidase MepM/ murein hydrolase activator NlpD